VKAFIQNVHHFRDDAIVDPAPPVEHVAIFDEAQRASTLEMTANFMRRKKNIATSRSQSPSFYCPTWIATRTGRSWSVLSAEDKRSTRARRVSMRACRP
jgi:hypothetical protein